MTDGLLADLPDDVYVRLKSDLLVIGDTIMTDRHHDSGDNYEDADPQNQIGGIIPSFSLSGWLRHGMERAIIDHRDGSVCHPGEANANFKSADIYERDLDAGYHPKGSCVDGEEVGCVVNDLFGGFERQPGKFMRRPIQFNPVRSGVDYLRGQAEGHYRRVNRNVVSRNAEDARTPLRATDFDAVANLDGCWHLKWRECKPEFIALLVEGIGYLDDHNTDFMHQMGGARNFGAGIMDVALINPLYTEQEMKRLFDRSKGSGDTLADEMEARKTVAMQDKDEQWADEYVPEFEAALDHRVEAITVE